jgi:hypothetical protein
MRSLVVSACILCAATVAVATPARADFPTPPPNVRLHTARGVLTDWGAGNRSGGLTIRTASGKRVFALSTGITINGKPVVCAFPPRGGKPRDPVMCDSWPSNVVIGKTPVRVSYWTNARAGDPSERDVAQSLATSP